VGPSSVIRVAGVIRGLGTHSIVQRADGSVFCRLLSVYADSTSRSPARLNHPRYANKNRPYSTGTCMSGLFFIYTRARTCRHTHARRAHTHTHLHTQTHAHTRARTHACRTHTHTYAQRCISGVVLNLVRPFVELCMYNMCPIWQATPTCFKVHNFTYAWRCWGQFTRPFLINLPRP
jgi:hypothetical protein